ncbi:BEN domain-containing protein 3 isoform X2 [Esox lucius]|uniref:BEN domain-containing protein n=1 Tax=Esox lucius TaxID=8010 RepID=A0A3P8XRR7_ESOLU|nr:BEN domain-containing protein 3 isoform X2 [Esox lucius]
MNSSDHGENSNGEMLERESEPVEDIKTETDDCAISETPGGPRRWSVGNREATSKRTATDMGCGAQNSESDHSTRSKRFRVSSEAGRRLLMSLSEESTRPQPQCLASGEKDHAQETISSYRKPLYSISHRITEKKLTSSQDHHAQHEGGVRVSFSSLVSPQLVNTGEHSRNEPNLSVLGATGSIPSTDSNIYSLIEKMFFILNTLNSSMTQLHSKVDLLSLEVTRIKKLIKPSEMVTEFQPPPEYLLTSEELSQLMEQTSNAGELGCRLLVHLFPELFKAKECTRCISNKRTLDSLHLQLIRNYVEVCFPLVKNNNIWQDECLLQINDFFNRFWVQKDMESVPQSCEKQTIAGFGFKAEQNQPCHFINEEGQEVDLSLDSNSDHTNNNILVPDLGFDTQVVGEDMDDLSSPQDFVVFLVNRFFPEIFEGRLPEGSVGKMILDSDRIEIIRKYMEANFPDVPEDSWLQMCVQRIEDVMEGSHSDGNGSEPENMNDESYDSRSLPENVSIVKIRDLCDYERPGRRSKKSLLVPVDFEQLEIPLPDSSVPQEYLLSREQLRNNYDCSLSIGNFASRLLVLMFPELFTYENARKHYNCSGSLGKKQLDPVRVNLIRHYVQLLYPPAKNDRVWTLEFVGKLDERCRRRDTEQRRSYQQQRKVYGPEIEQEPVDLVAACQVNQLNIDHLKEDFEIPPLPPEKSSKDFCKIPLEELTVSIPDFPVPSVYLLSDTEVREIVQQSLSVGNFAARLLVRLFPELFTQENLRLQYNHSGACNKKQLDPVRLRLIRHYVEAVYPVEKIEEVWHYECVPSIDERCRRPNRKKCDILKKAKRSNTVS